MTEMEKFNLFIDERINLASSDRSLAAYIICKKYVNEHFSPKVEEKCPKTWKDWEDKIIYSSKIMHSWTVPEKLQHSFTTADFGVIDYFIKSNKLLIRKENKWITDGLQWLINYIKE
jgi:hypothetical protein